MFSFDSITRQFSAEGYAVVNGVFSAGEVLSISKHIDTANRNNDNFRKTSDLFAIRQFLKEVPEVSSLVFNARFKALVKAVMGNRFFVVKSIYFDKPPASNWYVAYHQDLTISVDKKLTLDGFGPWTTKLNQFAVQAPVEILENICTFRIHLDDTNEHNGALRVVPKSHVKKIYRPETIRWAEETEVYCPVQSGGVMLMKPLTLHSSSRTTDGRKRRVIHIECASIELPESLQWAERMEMV